MPVSSTNLLNLLLPAVPIYRADKTKQLDIIRSDDTEVTERAIDPLFMSFLCRRSAAHLVRVVAATLAAGYESASQRDIIIELLEWVLSADE